MSIQQLIDTIMNAAYSQDTQSENSLVKQVLNLSNDEIEEKIIKLRGTGCKSICSAPLPKNILFYKCFDCSKEPTHVYCQECYQPEKHQNHVVTYEYSNGGCCDCGDILVMKKTSFCNKHSQKNVQIPSAENLFGQNLAERFKWFIMVSFALLYERTQRIVDYTENLEQKIQEAITTLEFENSQQFMDDNVQEFLEKGKSLKEGEKLYSLIFKVLKFVTVDNIPWSYATSKYLQMPIDINIQKLIKLYHIHPTDQFAKFKLDNQAQVCPCSILNLFVKHNVFFSRFLQENDDSIQDLFYELHVDENFKLYLCKQILIHFNHLYNPIQVYKLITTDNQQIKFRINASNYSAYSEIYQIFPQILQNKNIKTIYCKNKIERASIFQYFYQFMGHLALCILSLYKEQYNTQIYQLFDIFSNHLLQLPICDYKTHLYCSQFDDMVLSQFQDEIVKRLFEQMSEILSSEAETFIFSPFLPKNAKFAQLQNASLLINTLTKVYPCQQTQATTFYFLTPQVLNKFYIAEIIQISTLVSYRKLLSVVVNTWNDVYKQNKFGLQNIFRLIINYYLNNYISSFTLKPQSILQNYLSNVVLCDRNFITLLSLFLIDYNDSQGAYEDLLETSGLTQERFRDVMFKLLQRTLLNYIILSQNGNPPIYRGQIKIYKEQIKLKEVSLEQIDVSYVQLYAFIFGAQGINDIVSSYKEIATFFEYNQDPSFLICRIAQTDYDLIQCVGDMFGNELPESFQKGLNKLFQTIFFAQSFYQENNLRDLLNKFSYDSSLDLQKLILSSCELNQDNEQLQLKKSLLPVQYEPIYASIVLELKEQISDKLQKQNDKKLELFGTALANELNQLNQQKSTLTPKRLAILKSIAYEPHQLILKQIVMLLQTQKELGLIKNIQEVLEDYSVYINLVFLCNKHFQSPNEILQQSLITISQICYQITLDDNTTQTSNGIYQIFSSHLDETLIIGLLQNDQQKAGRSQQKKVQYKQKFSNMGSNFSSQISETQTQTQMSTENCSLCQLQFENDEIQYRALLIQYSNIHHHIKMIPEVQTLKEFDFFSIVTSFCQHTFHKQCLQKNEQKFSIGEFQYIRCPICLCPFNFPFVSPIYIKDAKDTMLAENLQFFLETLDDKRMIDYYQKYSIKEEVQITKILDEIYSQILCNLVFQLLSDLTKFKQKNTHLLLQDVLSLLRIIYFENQTTILEKIPENKNKILFDILNLIIKFKIKNNDTNTFIQELQLLLSQNPNKSSIIEALTEDLINSNVTQELLPYDLEKLSDDLKQNYIAKFQLNFKEFLLKHYLLPCKKKQCKFLPLQRLENQEQCQYICLICFKKMCCHHCGQKQKKKNGNLSRHCQKRHCGKTLYLNLKTSQIIIMQLPYITLNNNPLFKNLIGELPYIGYYPSIYYERFKLNLKALDQIIEIVVRDKFVHKLFQNFKQVKRTTL